jgi:uncharacterized protein YqjF (DUF2071 family)
VIGLTVKQEETPSIRFLNAEWRWLAMLNYEIDPALVQPYLPAGTEIDFFEGKTYVSLVGFMFLGTKVIGIPVPFHRNFEEVNLRFYVRRKSEDGWRARATTRTTFRCPCGIRSWESSFATPGESTAAGTTSKS